MRKRRGNTEATVSKYIYLRNWFYLSILFSWLSFLYLAKTQRSIFEYFHSGELAMSNSNNKTETCSRDFTYESQSLKFIQSKCWVTTAFFWGLMLLVLPFPHFVAQKRIWSPTSSTLGLSGSLLGCGRLVEVRVIRCIVFMYFPPVFDCHSVCAFANIFSITTIWFFT